eukprot:INCI10990.2.p1 GENE.INCI10990.2~~INCI10990.2.p1  ORF type:complete len:751 (-),score=167.97 INCI10990.2:251-2470(-)
MPAKKMRRRIDDDDDDDDDDDSEDNDAPAPHPATGTSKTDPASASSSVVTSQSSVSTPATLGSVPVVAEPTASPDEKKSKASWGFFGMKATAKAAASDGSDDSCTLSVEGAWPRGTPVPYKAMADIFGKLEATTKRLEIIRLVSDFFRLVITLTPEDLLPVVYLANNSIAPQFENVELGIGDTVIKKALQEATGRSAKAINAALKSTGDLGEVAEGSKKNIRTLYKPPPLTVRQVFQKFKDISTIAGAKSGMKKGNIVKSLLAAGSGLEGRYIVRALQGKMRINMAEQSVLVALSQAFARSPPHMTVPENLKKLPDAKPSDTDLAEAEEKLKQVFSEYPSFDAIIPVVSKHGLHDLHNHVRLTPGIPVRPMLAKPTKGVSEVLDRFEGVTFTCEYKYDGERAQIHMLPDGTVKIFSRSLEDNTPKFPDVCRKIRELCGNGKPMAPGAETFILDSEIVAWNTETGKILPFQQLSTRARKGVEEADIKIQVVVYAFDLLFLNGNPLIHTNLGERQKLMRETFQPHENVLQFAKAMQSSDTEELNVFLQKSVEEGCEGLMVKTLEENARYLPSKRSLNWLKLKKDYMDGVGDSLDLVPIAAWHGKGKRTGTYGAYLLACYDEDDDQYQSVCKVGTGFGDSDLATLYDTLKKTVIPEPKNYYCVSDSFKPDVWFEPTMVFEVKCADLSISPNHKAGLGLLDDAPDKGIALRFPRFMHVREDKKPEGATTAEQVVDMFKNQSLR